MLKRSDSLNRCHHIANRLEKLSKSSFESGSENLNGSRTSTVLNQEQVDAQEALGKQALAKIALARRASSQAHSIRRILVATNGKLGINEILADIQNNQNELKRLKSLGEIGKRVLNLPNVSDVNDALATSNNSNSIRAYHDGVAFRTVPLKAFVSFEDEVSQIEARLGALNDQLAEANSSLVDFEIDKELAALIGLS